MRVSTLIVTNRPEYVPWWAWNVRKQTWRPEEVVVVTNHPDVELMRQLVVAEELPTVFDSLPPSAKIGELRQRALDLASGDIITWFDDDDWQWSENIERMAAPIASRPDRYWMSFYPFSHKLSVATTTLYPVEGSDEPWLPSTATLACVAKRYEFQALSQAEDVYWMDVVRKHCADKQRWDFTGKPPSMNVMLIMHGRNVYSQEWRQKYEGAPRNHPLRAYPHRNVSAGEWKDTLLMLKEVFGVEPVRNPSAPL